MSSYVPPKKNAAFVFYVSLTSQSSRPQFQANPTLASGDVKVAVDDGAPANLATLPTVDGDFTKRVKVSLSSDEMNGDNISVLFSDQAGDEWDDLMVLIQTSARQVDDLLPTASYTAPANSTIADISSRLPDALTGDGNIKADALKLNGATPNNLAAGAQMDLVNAPNATAIAAIQNGLATAVKLLSFIRSLARKDFSEDADIGGNYDAATDSLEAIRDRGDAAWGPGGGNGGSLSLTYTLTSTEGGAAIQGATVELYAEAGMLTLLDSQVTNAFGVVVFENLLAGTYYLKRIKPRWTFVNPDTEVVSS